METYLRIAVAIAILLLCIVVFIRTYKAYNAAVGSRYKKFMAIFQHSGTILWARFMASIGVVMTLLVNTVGMFDGSPEIQDAIKAVLRPEYVPYYVIIISVLTEVIRRSPGSPNPLAPAPLAALNTPPVTPL